ncbi:hypothetical protein [Sinanaerobacter chloroacetimidivorans]|uniref:Uncharacterized protein n=1 Tax=Sinanaerobacter chloroacetimidivorans TaxID=2818044 RepID=A0A8J8B069_9FIRM|nr:hypothetical protein [Sinanaerobacter chloroacetimidivorans]MBR0596291.1 hypothetical protein [Sinanaerobacter chloroacetimidivorans]
MKNKNLKQEGLLSFIGFIILIAGFILLKFPAEGSFKILPYLLIGLGAGYFGQHITSRYYYFFR